LYVYSASKANLIVGDIAEHYVSDVTCINKVRSQRT